jgi:monofunctional glycosyltransferase
MNPRRPPTLQPPSPPDRSGAPPLYVPPRRQPPEPAEPQAARARRRGGPAGSHGASGPGRPLLSRLVGFVVWLLLTLMAFVLGVVLLLRWVPPPTTAFMLQSPVQPVKHLWVPAERIADPLKRAVVASEDQKFWTHKGFDFEAIEQALEQQRDGGRQRGASTISQQVAKNLFLWPGGGYARKGIEAGFTVLIETLWPKTRILEVYLNIAEFGRGVYGAEAAAQALFGKPADQLTADEAARLAAVLPSPRRWSAREPGPYVRSRADWILGQMGQREAVPTASAPEPQLDPAFDDVAPATVESSSGDSVEVEAFDDFDRAFSRPRPITDGQAIGSTPEPASPP